MMNREVTYERNIAGSYMKIPMSRVNEFDEKLILKQQIPGIIPVEKCFVNGQGEYWYQISGKQSLDTYSKIQKIGISFIEQVILSICSLIEAMEWNLFSTECLLLEPEYIYVSNVSKEINFCLYPESNQNLCLEFQQLMEYLLKRIDHQDEEAVKLSYEIYEQTLEEEYNILDIKNFILRRRQERFEKKDDGIRFEKRAKDIIKEEKENAIKKENPIRKENSIRKENPIKKECSRQEAYGEEERGLMEWASTVSLQYLWELLSKKLEEFKEYLNREKKRESYIVEPEEYEEPVKEEIHPTVCIGVNAKKEEGLLIYEGSENFPDIHIEKNTYIIGKGTDVELVLSKDTISRHHAKLLKEEDGYYIEDLNSLNGTFLNDRLLAYKKREKLESNDIISFADVKYRFI